MVLAFSQPLLVATSVSLLSPSIRFATWCHVGLERLSYRTFGLACLVIVVLATAIALTFATEVTRNRKLGMLPRLVWMACLVVASPVAVPAYWFVHLRD